MHYITDNGGSQEALFKIRAGRILRVVPTETVHDWRYYYANSAILLPQSLLSYRIQ